MIQDPPPEAAGESEEEKEIVTVHRNTTKNEPSVTIERKLEVPEHIKNESMAVEPIYDMPS